MSRLPTVRRTVVLAVAGIALATTPPQSSAYTVKAYKWDTLQVPFYVNTQNSDVSSSAALEAVKFGAYAWTNQTMAAFSFYYAGSTSGSTVTNNGKNEVFFRNSSNGSSIATTYTYYSGSRILDTDIVFWDGAYQFFTGTSGCSGGFYIEDIATHEFGHALGLGHSSVSGATMQSGAKYCAIDHRWLAENDKLGVEYLYPSGSTNSAPTVSISSPSNGASFAEGSSITFSGSANDKEDGDIGSHLVWVSSLDGQIGTGKSFKRVLSAGSHTVTARVTDSSGAIAQAQVGVTVTTASTSSSSRSFVLSAKGYKVKGLQKADLTWSGATSTSVDVYRNGTRIVTTPNDGHHTDAINQRGGGSYSYVLCHAGTSTCSNMVSIVF